MKKLLLAAGLALAFGGCGGLETGDKPLMSTTFMLIGLAMVLVGANIKEGENNDF